MRAFTRLLLLLAVLAGTWPSAASAQVVDGVELVQADLLADTGAIVPGKPFTVGLRLKMAPHWHTYWQYSGDAGLPTTIAWKLPDGFKAGPIQWPLPEKISSPGDIENYGYSEEVVLLTEITPPAQLPPGDVLLKAKASWLVCEKICVPGAKELELKLGSGGSSPSGDAAIIEHYRSSLPKAYDPAAADFKTVRAVENGALVWRLTGLNTARQQGIELFPLPPEEVQIGHPAIESAANGSVTIRVPILAGENAAAKVQAVLGLGEAGARTGWFISADSLPPVKAAAAPLASPIAVKAPAEPSGALWRFLLLGVLGGLILNVMPCVLPVISLKLFTFIKQANEDPARIWRMGLAYAAGVFTWFMGFAVLVVVLKSAGRELGYSFQLQNPWFILGLAAITFVFALNLLGVFEIILPGALTNTAGEAAASREGYAGAFFQGVLATVLGSACTAPVFGTALGFAFSQSGPVILAMFAAISAGMSAPFVVLAARPGWLHFLPKPGLWMERVKQGTGFLMLATVLWLLSVLGGMRGPDAVIWAGALLLALGAACWVQGAFNNLAAAPRSRWLARAAIVLLAILGGGWCVQQVAATRLPENGPHVSFATQLDTALKTGRPVFVDFTASWCVNCKVNERLVLNTDHVRQALRQRNAVFLTADWTNGDEDITKVLRQFNRAAVPLYVIYPAGNAAGAIVLPELLTQGIVLSGLAAADKAALTRPLASR